MGVPNAFSLLLKSNFILSYQNYKYVPCKYDLKQSWVSFKEETVFYKSHLGELQLS